MRAEKWIRLMAVRGQGLAAAALILAGCSAGDTSKGTTHAPHVDPTPAEPVTSECRDAVADMRFASYYQRLIESEPDADRKDLLRDAQYGTSRWETQGARGRTDADWNLRLASLLRDTQKLHFEQGDVPVPVRRVAKRNPPQLSSPDGSGPQELEELIMSLSTSSYAITADTKVLLINQSFEWFQGLQLVIELRRMDGKWSLAGLGRHISSDFVESDEDGFAVVEWRPAVGSIRLDSRPLGKPPTTRLAFDVRTTIRGLGKGVAEIWHDEPVEDAPFIVHRYLRDARLSCHLPAGVD